jgi:hypothetical protein
MDSNRKMAGEASREKNIRKNPRWITFKSAFLVLNIRKAGTGVTHKPAA